MIKINNLGYKSLNILILLFIVGISFNLKAEPIFKVKTDLFNLTQPDTLGLTQANHVEHIKVFNAVKDKAQYNHGAVLFGFKNQLFIQWQSSKQDEDGPDTHVLYSTSQTGKNWSQAKTLAPERSNAIVTSGGWWSDGKTLVAFINVWPKNLQPKAGHVEYATSTDGINWSEFLPVLDKNNHPIKGIMEQDLKALPNGRILTAIHIQPGLIATPFYTDDPLAISGWQQAEFTNLEHKGDISRELEPSWFLKANGDIAMVFRDQASSFKVLAALSKNNGESWSLAQLTNMPDSRAKQSAGNFTNGMAYLVNNPTGNKNRMPLVVSLSQTGEYFDQAYILRGKTDLPPMRYQGKYKRVGFSYPKSLVFQGKLWVSYAVNKEDIAVTSLDLAQFEQAHAKQ
ncbi:exo-alpha-sialidase [Catenovulum sp. 2E275]|uniref:exo-alpha-sialidase n=1 Tax=Catenovulum sp. 2E275 TaxID=2980497 RepID=UPI0021CFDFFD|nr:exo-alpha-sialidase [Catenovulum sp. 2E275]MCU4677314.1 exo-alpha-sialidase [Catenovulum sp. 2E275]